MRGGLFGTLSGTEGPGVYLQANSYGGLLIDGSEFRGTVSSEASNIGGLIGVMESYSLNESVPYLVTIQQSKAIASVAGDNSVGGIAGAMYGAALIQDSYSLPSTTGTSSVGGIVGYQGYGSLVRRTYSAGSVVSLDDHGGGIVGYLENSGIENSYSAGSVSAGGGGVIGEYISGDVTNVYYDQQRAGTTECTSSGVLEAGCTAVNTGGSPDEVYFYNTYSHAPLDTWDFTDVWRVRALNHAELRHGYHAPIVDENIPMLGDGSESDPYQITNCTQLQNINEDLVAYYRIENDLDCSETESWNEGQGFSPIGIEHGTFSGHLDGAHHTIYDLTMHRPFSEGYVGLFGIVDGGSVENINLTRPTIISDATTPSMFGGVGVIAGAGADQIFRGIHVTGANVSGSLPVGGIVGFSVNFTDPTDIAYEDRGIAYSSVEDSILTATGFYGAAGGLVGGAYGSAIHDSYTRADVNGEAAAGGIVAFVTGASLDKVYAFGSVVSSLGDTSFFSPGVGGLVGMGDASFISSSFAVLPVTGVGPVGGIIGNGEAMTLTNVLFDQTATTQSACAGPAFVDPMDCTAVNADGSDSGHFYSTTTIPPFTVSEVPMWDFSRVWSVFEGAPVLRTFIAPPHIPANPRVTGDFYATTTFAWDATSSTNEGEIQGYRVEYTGGAFENWESVEVASSTTSYAFAPGTFERSTAYQFRVRAYQAGPMESALYGFATEPVEFTTSDTSFTTTTWTASSTNSWDDAANWSNGLPNSSTNAVIPFIGAGYHPYLWSAVTVHSLTIQEGAEVFLRGQNLTIDGGVFVNAGTFILQGTETLTGLTQDVTQGAWMYTGVEGGPPATYTIHDFGAEDYFDLVLTSFTGNDTFRLENDLKLNGSLTLNSGLLDAHSFDNGSTHEPGLFGEYSYTPNFDFGVTSTVDTLIDFEDTTLNGTRYLQSETFSTRWEGQVLADYAEEYSFCTHSDDGARLWVNGQLLVDAWTEHMYETHCGSITLESGSWNTIRLEYNQYGGPGALRLTYSSMSQEEVTVPASHLRHGVFVPHTIDVTRDWVNPGAGRFDAFGSTVRFVGGMQTIYGTATFYNFEKVATETAGLLFSAYSYMGVLHQITLQGVTDHLLQVRRDEPSAPELPPWFMQWTNAIVDIENVAVRNVVNFGDHMIVVRDTASTDLGNNYGWQINKTTPPEITYDGVDTGTTGADVYWASVDRLDASSTIMYGTSTAYGLSQTVFSRTLFELADLMPGTTYHYKIVVTDASGNYGEGEDDTFTTFGDVSAPEISDIVTVSHATSVRMTWSTNEPTNGRAIYSVNRSYASSSELVDESPLTTEHEVTIGDLIPCAQYRVRLLSTDEALNTGTSTEQTVLTQGCPGNATDYGSEAEEFDLSEESIVLTENEGRIFRVAAPAHFVTAEEGVVLLLRSIGKGESLAALGLPAEGLEGVTPFTYDVKAIAGAGTVVGAFDHPVTISLHYLESDITGLDPASLRLYHSHDGVWSELDECENNVETQTIVCTAPHFSTFALFGRTAAPVVVSSGSGGGGGGSAGSSANGSLAVYGCTDKRAKNYDPRATNQAYFGQCQYATLQESLPLSALLPVSSSSTISTTMPLASSTTCATSLVPTSMIRLQGKNRVQDVMQLQRFLNAYEGSHLTVDGIYSLPVQQAVMAWQLKNKAVVLAPFGLKKGTGNVLGASLALLKKQETARCAPPARAKEAPRGTQVLFKRTLKVGDTGEDVRQLQKYLNDHGYRVASQGAGSPGNETSTFGPGLVNALKKFQLDHAELLLKPFNLSKPTGAFGTATKALVNSGI